MVIYRYDGALLLYSLNRKYCLPRGNSVWAIFLSLHLINKQIESEIDLSKPWFWSICMNFEETRTKIWVIRKVQRLQSDNLSFLTLNILKLSHKGVKLFKIYNVLWSEKYNARREILSKKRRWTFHRTEFYYCLSDRVY